VKVHRRMVHLGRSELRWEDCSREGASKDGPLGEKGTEVRGVQQEGASKDGPLWEKGTEVGGLQREGASKDGALRGEGTEVEGQQQIKEAKIVAPQMAKLSLRVPCKTTRALTSSYGAGGIPEALPRPQQRCCVRPQATKQPYVDIFTSSPVRHS
jgi:hypothetical protein